MQEIKPFNHTAHKKIWDAIVTLIQESEYNYSMLGLGLNLMDIKGDAYRICGIDPQETNMCFACEYTKQFIKNNESELPCDTHCPLNMLACDEPFSPYKIINYYIELLAVSFYYKTPYAEADKVLNKMAEIIRDAPVKANIKTI